MSILYNRMRRVNIGNPEAPRKWYLIPKSISQIKEEILYKKIGEKLNMTSGTVRSVFEATQEVIIDYLTQSYTVKISAIGNFSVNFESYPAVSKEEAKPSILKRKYVNINPCDEIQNAINETGIISAESLKGGSEEKALEAEEISDPNIITTTAEDIVE